MIIGEETGERGETLAEAGERAKHEFQATFYGLIGFVLKEFKICIAAMKNADAFDKLPDDTLTYMHETFSRHCKAYIAAKKRYRERGMIVSPDVGLSLPWSGDACGGARERLAPGRTLGVPGPGRSALVAGDRDVRGARVVPGVLPQLRRRAPGG